MAETERLRTSSEIFIINATSLSVDVYVNFLTQPSISDPKPVGLSPTKDELNALVFVAKDDYATPYGVYTFSIRPKGEPGAAVLGEASIDLRQGRSHTGVFHELDAGRFQLSIYENDLSEGGLARLTVIHAARPAEVSWEIRPNGEDPRIPADVRSGTLGRGEWQMATNVVDNDYIIEFFVDGAVVARHPDLDLARAKNFVVILFGNPQPTSDAQALLRPIVFQELELDPGPAEPSVVTSPAPPLSASNQNAPVEFTCEPISLWQTNAAAAVITAADPDGKVVNLSIDEVRPKVGGLEVLSGSLQPSTAIGSPATVVLTIKSDVPHGSYNIIIGANRGSMAHQATCSVPLRVRPITIDRLHQVTNDYKQSGDIEANMAEALHSLLRGAAMHLNTGDVEQACHYLKDVLSLLGSQKGKAVADVAHDHIERETKALRADLRCG